MNAYTDKLIDLIEKNNNPGLLCNTVSCFCKYILLKAFLLNFNFSFFFSSQLHLCPVNYALIEQWDLKRLQSTIEDKKSFALSSKKDGPVFKVNWCKICKTAYPFLQEAMQIDEAKIRLQNVAHSFCDKNILPIKDCSRKADEFIEVIQHEKDTVAGCQKLTLCAVDEKIIEKDQIVVELEVLNLAAIDPELASSLDLANLNKNIQSFGWWDDDSIKAKGIVKILNFNYHLLIIF